MHLILRIFVISSLFLSTFHIASGQVSEDSVQRADTTWYFRDDTLFSNVGITIYRGQHLFAGNGSADEARYGSIWFRSPFAFPIWFLRDQELKNNMDYQNNEGLRDADKVREYLSPGSTLIVKKIKSRYRKKKWHYYEIIVWDGRSSLSMKYKCDITTAMSRKEILLQPPPAAKN